MLANKIKAGILTLILLAGMLAGAGIVNAEGLALTVNVKDTNYAMVDGSGLLVKIYNADGSLNQQLSGKNPAYFALEKGIYNVVASKEGYKAGSWNVNMNDGAQGVTVLMEKLPSQPSEPGTDPTEPTEPTEPSETTSNDVVIKDVEFDDEVAPNQEMAFDVELDNTAKYDAEDVTVTITIKGIDDGDDLEVEEDFSTLEADDKDTFTLTTTIPKKVDAKFYSFEVKVEWEDEDGTEYVNYKDYTDAFEVVKEKHDVQITSALFIASSVEAGKSNQASVSLWNAGKEDETVKIKIEVPDLKIAVTSAQFDLDENDESTQYISFSIPSNAKAGKYYAYATVYFNDGTANNMETLMLEVKGAAATQSDTEVTVTPIVVTTQTEAAGGKFGGLGKTGLIAGAIIVLIVLAMLYREYAPQFQPKPTIIKTARGGK